jgi:ubiquitin-conjugating enzyme E2 Q
MQTEAIPLVELDPLHRLTIGTKNIEIPQPSYQIEKLLGARLDEYLEEDPDAEDRAVFEAFESQSKPPTADDKTDWTPDAQWVEESIRHLMPPPVDSTPSATMAIQRELMAMLKEQKGATSLRDLGWYMPPDREDNLFQWVVEMHSFDATLPIAKDMEAK